MTETFIDDMHRDDQERVRHVREYFARRRTEAIRRYHAATMWVQRHDARAWALHYGRLLRRMEGRA